MKSLGSTHAGLGEWLVQRLSAVYIGLFSLYVAVSLGTSPAGDYLAWKDWLAQGHVRLGSGLFFLSLVAHAWIGMRSVFMDYARPFWLRLVVTLFTGALLLAFGLWLAQILISMGAR